ncbi:MAG: transposase [Nitrososphaerota archaeon]|nr:transposase [Nitrososphaerota archaeon]
MHKARRGRPRPKTVYADTNITCASLNRMCLDRKGIRQRIPESQQKRARPGRPRGFYRPMYHGVRYNVERFFGWMENYRKITIRYERIPNLFLSLIQLACIMILWRVLK